jgi:lipopolysaccharide transport system ATP-binding protein
MHPSSAEERNLLMHSNNVVISAKNLTKIYRLYSNPMHRVRQALDFTGRKYYQEFSALNDVSFDIHKGETIGIVGRNGSGKSTLLQLMCGIRKPSSGFVRVNGRVSALLELGAGFHPEFTGRENVYMQGAIMGMSREEMDRRFSDIEAFADIGIFIEQAVKTYSSGMFLRLAFAVAVSVDPDILVVDEALAVGDSRFQSKCFRRLEMMKNAGTTILMVSHSLEQITRLCDTVLLLDGGRLVDKGDPGTMVNQYLNLLFGGTLANHSQKMAPTKRIDHLANFNDDDIQERYHLRPAYNPNEYRWGNRSAMILDFLIQADNKDHVACVGCKTSTIVVGLKVFFRREVSRPIFGLVVKTKDGTNLCSINSVGQTEISGPRKPNELVFLYFTLTPNLAPGDYFISVGVADDGGEEIVPLDRRYDSIHLNVVGQTSQTGVVNMSPELRIADIIPLANEEEAASR